MGKPIVILLVGTLIILAVLNLSMIERNNQATRTSENQFALKQARLIANSTVNMHISKLSDDHDWRQTTAAQTNYFDGLSTSKVVDTLLDGREMIKITAEGEFYGAATTVTALIKAPNLLPPPLEYAIFGGEEVKLNGTNIKVKDANDPTLNSNVHSNDKVTFDGTNLGVEGFVTYKNSITPGGAVILPNDNPNNLPVYYKATVAIPSIDISSYESKADIVYNGDKTFSGVINLGSRSDPYIIYVKGKVFLSGTLNGYGIIIAEGDVEINSSLTNLTQHPEYSKFHIVTQGKFIVNNQSTTTHTTVYAKDEVVINAKDAVIEGGLVSLKKVTLNNQNIDVRYKPLVSTLSDQIFGKQTPKKRLEVSHWNE